VIRIVFLLIQLSDEDMILCPIHVQYDNRWSFLNLHLQAGLLSVDRIPVSFKTKFGNEVLFDLFIFYPFVNSFIFNDSVSISVLSITSVCVLAFR
jgi:hypothetical protein